METTIFGIDFVTHQTSDKKLWRLYVKNLDIPVNSYYRSQKKAYNEGIKLLQDKGEAEKVKAYKYALKRKIKTKFFNDLRIQALFSSIFKLPLMPLKDRFMFGMAGETCLDVMYFDTLLKTPSGVSCKDHIKSNYGDKALKLVTKLM